MVKLTRRELSVWSVVKHAWVGVPGEYGVFVGSSSSDLRLNGTLASV